MNKILRELSGKVCDSLDDGDWKIPDEFVERFAEALVRECANYAFSNEQDYYSMLKHFGIDE